VRSGGNGRAGPSSGLPAWLGADGAKPVESRGRADIVRMDFTARTAFRELEAAYCLEGAAGICGPDEAAYRAVIDAEIEMGQAT